MVHIKGPVNPVRFVHPLLQLQHAHLRCLEAREENIGQRDLLYFFVTYRICRACNRSDTS